MIRFMAKVSDGEHKHVGLEDISKHSCDAGWFIIFLYGDAVWQC